MEIFGNIINWFIFAGLIVTGYYFYKAFSLDKEEYFSKDKK